MVYAYYNPMWENARRDHSTYYVDPEPTTWSSVIGDVGSPSTPLNSYPRSQPFLAREPTQVPYTPRFFVSQAEEEWRAAEAAYSARQRELYAIPGVGELTPEMRSWNGRRFEGPPPVQGLIPMAFDIVSPLFAATASALEGQVARGKSNYARLSFGFSWAYYHFLRCWRAFTIELGFLIARIKLVLFWLWVALFATWAILIAILKVATMMGADVPGTIEYIFEKEYHGWHIAAY